MLYSVLFTIVENSFFIINKLSIILKLPCFDIHDWTERTMYTAVKIYRFEKKKLVFHFYEFNF